MPATRAHTCSRAGKYPSAVTFPIRCGKALPGGGYQAPIMALLADFGHPGCTPEQVQSLLFRCCFAFDACLLVAAPQHLVLWLHHIRCLTMVACLPAGVPEHARAACAGARDGPLRAQPGLTHHVPAPVGHQVSCATLQAPHTHAALAVPVQHACPCSDPRAAPALDAPLPPALRAHTRAQVRAGPGGGAVTLVRALGVTPRVTGTAGAPCQHAGAHASCHGGVPGCSARGAGRHGAAAAGAGRVLYEATCIRPA